MSRLRVSAISYLNTAPLMWDFDHGDLRQKYRVDYTVPSICAEMLSKGLADIGIIPVAAYATIPDLKIIGDVCIASKGAVRSIYLVSKKQAERVATVAVDSSSRSSVALLRILFAKRWRAEPKFSVMEPKIDRMLRDHDAALVIGDPALKLGSSRPDGGWVLYDLGHEWQEMTGLPFVYAFWAIRADAISSPDIVRDFELSRDHGLEADNLRKTAAEWSPRLGLPAQDLQAYLTRHISYRLDEPCRRGLERFFQLAHEVATLPQAPPVAFLDAASSRTL